MLEVGSKMREIANDMEAENSRYACLVEEQVEFSWNESLKCLPDMASFTNVAGYGHKPVIGTGDILVSAIFLGERMGKK